MTDPADLIARADAWIATGLYQGAKPLVPALRDALAAANAREAALEAERDRLAALIMLVRRDADEWCISRMTGSAALEVLKADNLWQTIRRASGSVAPIETSAALTGEPQP